MGAVLFMKSISFTYDIVSFSPHSSRFIPSYCLFSRYFSTHKASTRFTISLVLYRMDR